MKQTTIVAVILGVLLLVSAVQAIQLSELKTKVSEGQVISSGSTKTIGSASSGSDTGKKATLPSNIKDLPQMVGGC